MSLPHPDASVVERRRAAALAGHRGDVGAARAALDDDDARVRAVALGALARTGALQGADLDRAGRDPSPIVRRRTAELAPLLAAADAGPPLLVLLDDADATVQEVAAFGLGELADEVPAGAVDRLATLVRGHDDALVREAAVAALGAIGDEASLPTVLHATRDKATVRRRAVLALAAFDGPEVDAALEAARGDRDWQVRQAAEDLLA